MKANVTGGPRRCFHSKWMFQSTFNVDWRFYSCYHCCHYQWSWLDSILMSSSIHARSVTGIWNSFDVWFDATRFNCHCDELPILTTLVQSTAEFKLEFHWFIGLLSIPYWGWHVTWQEVGTCPIGGLSWVWAPIVVHLLKSNWTQLDRDVTQNNIQKSTEVINNITFLLSSSLLLSLL